MIKVPQQEVERLNVSEGKLHPVGNFLPTCFRLAIDIATDKFNIIISLTLLQVLLKTFRQNQFRLRFLQN